MPRYTLVILASKWTPQENCKCKPRLNNTARPYLRKPKPKRRKRKKRRRRRVRGEEEISQIHLSRTRSHKPIIRFVWMDNGS